MRQSLGHPVKLHSFQRIGVTTEAGPQNECTRLGFRMNNPDPCFMIGHLEVKTEQRVLNSTSEAVQSSPKVRFEKMILRGGNHVNIGQHCWTSEDTIFFPQGGDQDDFDIPASNKVPILGKSEDVLSS